MNATNSNSMAQVAVYETTLPSLVALKQSPEEPLADVIKRITEGFHQRNDKPVLLAKQAKRKLPRKRYKYEIVFLDAVIAANSLGELYGNLVDALFDIAPEAVDTLAGMKSRTRHYIARDQLNIHPDSPHLPTLKTKSGWYVSKNIGKDDLRRGVKALCKAGGIKYDQDVRCRLKVVG